MENNKILIVEDDDLMQNMIKDNLSRAGYGVSIASDGIEGLEFIREDNYGIAVIDLKLPKMDGISLLKKIKELSPETIVIIMTGHGTIESAVSAMKLGAYDYITKPFLAEELVLIIKNGLELQRLRQENILLKQEINKRSSMDNIIGKSKEMQKVYSLIETVALTNATVLIRGESGTGKELIAEAIHHLSHRKDNALIKVNCSALPETILESELFGHEKGAFTDAVRKRIGRFELANKGSIFLDDIDDMKQSVQVKLLRVLQEKEYERVGGNETIKADVRVIAATKSDLKERVERGLFREDLYYRLNVVSVVLPSLRERMEDIPLLVNHFLSIFNKENGKKVKLEPETLQIMMRYDWPGNIRELENLIEKFVSLAIRDSILPEDLPVYFFEKKGWKASSLKKIVEETEKDHIKRVLESTGWNKKQSSEILGITPKTLWQKMKEYEIK